MVIRRRRAFLMSAEMSNVRSILIEHSNESLFYFGSQTEGTTTLGMKSDIDMLHCDNDARVIMDWADWELGKLCIMMIKHFNTPPQHCYLQLLRSDSPLPLNREITLKDEDKVIELNGMILLKNTFEYSFYRNQFGRVFFLKHGPSRSYVKEIDIVNAFYCNTTPPECQALFTRPKPGHWPRPDILTRARHCGIFLVPQGYSESDQSTLEWRFSTSLIERLLMFDLCIVKIQVYTFLKVLRKSFFKPLVSDRLSTFHFKTALLFTVESFPPKIWQEHNLLQCVIYCLKTLQRWFKLRCCPHYTIAGVDLFVGKLRKWEFPPLSSVLSKMIDNIMDYVSKIEMDQIGERIGDRHSAISTRHQNMLETALHCFSYKRATLEARFWTRPNNTLDLHHIRYIIIMVREIPLPSHIKENLMHSIKMLYQLLASSLASFHLQWNQPIPLNIYRLYEASLDSDLTSSRLKLASMLYCSGQFKRAELVLANTEKLLHADVLQSCPCPDRANFQPTERFKQKVFELSELEVIQSHVACNIGFYPSEIYCMPAFLVYELHRTIGPEDVLKKRPIHDSWMGLVMIDSIPFLYYLQYLTYRQLGGRERRLAALHKLRNYVSESCSRNFIETALHVLGHCYELENRYDYAWMVYKRSLVLYPHNNAAKWHIMRLTWMCYTSSMRPEQRTQPDY